MKLIVNNKSNILFIAPLPPPMTGQAIACKVLYDDLLTQGHSINLVNLSKKSFVSGIDSYARVKEIFHILYQVYKFRNKVDFVYYTPAESIAGNLKDIIIYCLLFKKLPLTYIHLHGGAGMRIIFSSEHAFLKNVNKFFISRMGGVIVLGDRLKSVYSGMIENNKIHIAYNFSLSEYFINRHDLKKKTNNISVVKILFLSNLLPGKGYKELLHSLQILHPEKLAKIEIDFAGGFEDEESKISFLNAIQKYPQIKYHGVVEGEKKQTLLRSAHVFCLPTYYPYEGQPISILEAYASGCAVITTDHSGIFDIFTPDVNGLQVEVKNIESIAEKISFLIENKASIRKFAIINAFLAKKKFRVKDHLTAMERILNLVHK